jgi:hypothetical protein
MPVPGLDAQRCRIRNAKAARKGLNAVPVRLLAQAPRPIDTNDPATEKGLRIVTASGTLPRTDAGVIERINKVRGEDQEPLTLDQVYVAYAEAGNSNFISKYFMFLSASTLRNISRRANRSIAFMNSHRTGGLSTPAELPYGRTFAGRFEQTLAPDGRTFNRTLLGVYMLRGEHPNGANGPSTDSIYSGIKAGTIFDVSLGIQGGDEVCDVCKYPLDYDDPDVDEVACGHIPGTHHLMTDDEIKASIARGVPDGVCSFTLEDATAGEVSPVFDGAVPGAGFRKALRAARARHLSAADLAEARRSFGPLARRRDFSANPTPPDRGRPAPQNRGPAMPKDPRKKTVTLAALGQLLSQAGIEFEDDDDAAETPAAAAAPARPATQAAAAATPTPAADRPASEIDERFRLLEEQNARLEQTLAAERQARETDGREQRRRTVLAQAESWAEQQVRLGAATPAERDEMVALYAQAATDDHEHPAQVAYRDATNTPKVGTRVQALAAYMGKRGRHDFSTEHVAPRDAPAAEGTPAGSAPLFDLAALPGQPKADPVAEMMLAGNARYHGVPNGKK